VAAAGADLLPEVAFQHDERGLESTYDLVVASNSLQYTEDWQGLFARLRGAARGRMYVTQVPMVEATASYVAVQRPYSHGYATEYVGWIFNREAFLMHASSVGLVLVREFYLDNEVHVHGSPETVVHRGFLFDAGSKEVGG
jgi:hypothetical protein